MDSLIENFLETSAVVIVAFALISWLSSRMADWLIAWRKERPWLLRRGIACAFGEGELPSAWPLSEYPSQSPEDNGPFTQTFYEHPRIRAISPGNPNSYAGLPDRISPGQFASVLLYPDETNSQKGGGITATKAYWFLGQQNPPDGSVLVRYMKHLIQDCEDDLDEVRSALETWYREISMTMSKRFRARALWYAFVPAFLICLAFQVNLITILYGLTSASELRDTAFQGADYFASRPDETRTLSQKRQFALQAREVSNDDKLSRDEKRNLLRALWRWPAAPSFLDQIDFPADRANDQSAKDSSQNAAAQPAQSPSAAPPDEQSAKDRLDFDRQHRAAALAYCAEARIEPIRNPRTRTQSDGGEVCSPAFVRRLELAPSGRLSRRLIWRHPGFFWNPEVSLLLAGSLIGDEAGAADGGEWVNLYPAAREDMKTLAQDIRNAIEADEQTTDLLPDTKRRELGEEASNLESLASDSSSPIHADAAIKALQEARRAATSAEGGRWRNLSLHASAISDNILSAELLASTPVAKTSGKDQSDRLAARIEDAGRRAEIDTRFIGGYLQAIPGVKPIYPLRTRPDFPWRSFDQRDDCENWIAWVIYQFLGITLAAAVAVLGSSFWHDLLWKRFRKKHEEAADA
ncbi:hypothetical protein B2G71_19115 [Novosphingobium sp. PC22D]|nr:hypothetical protein B2G71_19115 [Novosphingobium sp. PC22D]